jgi:hypothetical protein
VCVGQHAGRLHSRMLRAAYIAAPGVLRPVLVPSTTEPSAQ